MSNTVFAHFAANTFPHWTQYCPNPSKHGLSRLTTSSLTLRVVAVQSLTYSSHMSDATLLKETPMKKRMSPYARYNKKEFRYPNRDRTVCACGGILFRGLNDGSPGSVVKHNCNKRRKSSP